MGKVFKRPLPPRGPVPSNPNLLDNWYLADPINQRGLTEYIMTGTGNTYSVDRWVKTTYSWLKLSLVDGKTTMEAKKNRSSLTQTCDRPFHAGDRVTFSLLYEAAADGSFYINLSGVGSTEVHLPQGSGCICLTRTIPKDVSSLDVIIGATDPNDTNGTTTVDLIAAKLELGSQQTLAYLDEQGQWQLNDPPPDKALELAKCQYYLYPITNNETLRASAVFDGQARFTIPVTMADRALSVLAPENISFRPWGAGGEQAIIPSGWSAYVRPQGAVELRAHLSSIKLGEDYYLSVEDGQRVLLSNEL